MTTTGTKAFDEVENKVVVRLRTTYWYDGKSICQKKELTFLRRKCSGFNVVEEDLRDGGAERVFMMIQNLECLEDGVYEIIIIDEHYDWESGILDGYDYRLMPYTE